MARPLLVAEGATGASSLDEVATRADGVPPVPGPFGAIDLNGEYVGTVQLGMSGAAAGASNFDDEFVASPDVAIEAPIDAGFAPTDVGVVDTGETATDAAAPTEQATAPAEQQLLRRVVDKFGGRLGLVYLAFGFSVLGLCVAPRFTPARLPGLRP